MPDSFARGHSPVTRRSLLAGLGAGAAVVLAAACGGVPPALRAIQPAAAAPTTAPAAGAGPTSGGLKGTRLSILAGWWFVPAMNTLLEEMVQRLSADTGMVAKVERLEQLLLGPRIQAIVESGTGADMTVLADTDPFIFGDKLSDVSDVAADVDKAWGGWYDIARQTCIVNGKWRGLLLGQAPNAWNWRPDFFQAAGVDAFPDTYDELLVAAKKLKTSGKPMGMNLGHAAVGARSTSYPVLWAFGGKEFEADGKTVALSSPGTLASIEWYVEAFHQMPPAVLRWLDPDGSQAFVAEQVSATTSVNTIYLAARAAGATDPAKLKTSEAMDHANWPKGPAGRFGQFSVSHWSGFSSSKNQDGIRAFLGAYFNKKFLIPLTKAGQSSLIPALSDIENADAWSEDPKLKIFRELNKLNHQIGRDGPSTSATAKAVARFTLTDMYAQAVTGKMTPAEAMNWTTDLYTSFAAKE